MDRCPDAGTAPRDAGASASDSSVSAAPGGVAEILAFPTGARVSGGSRPAPCASPAPSGGGLARSVPSPEDAFVGIRRDPATGWTEVSGVDVPGAAGELGALGLHPLGVGRYGGVVSRGDFRLLLATWSDLLELGARPAAVPAREESSGPTSAPASGRASVASPAGSGSSAAAGPASGPATVFVSPTAARDGAPAHGPKRVDGGEAGGCPICGRRPTRAVGTDFGLATDFPELLCPDCDRRAMDAGGIPLASATGGGAAPNPVYVDGQRCWRLYRFGGWVTLVDRHGARSFADFLDRARESRRPR